MIDMIAYSIRAILAQVNNLFLFTWTFCPTLLTLSEPQYGMSVASVPIHIAGKSGQGALDVFEIYRGGP